MFFDYRYCYETPAVTSNDLKQKDEWNHLEGQEMGLLKATWPSQS